MAGPENPEEVDIITVGKTEDDGKCGLWDRDPLHPSNYGAPKGEVFIGDMRPYQVHRNAGVQQKLGEKAIRELRDREIQQRTEAAEEAETERLRIQEEARATASANAVAVPVAAMVVPVVPTPPPTETQEQPETQERGDGEDDTETGSETPPAGSGSAPIVRRPSVRRTANGETPER